MKNRKSNFGFSYTYTNMANFEAFGKVISSSINLLFLKSAYGDSKYKRYFTNSKDINYVIHF